MGAKRSSLHHCSLLLVASLACSSSARVVEEPPLAPQQSSFSATLEDRSFVPPDEGSRGHGSADAPRSRADDWSSRRGGHPARHTDNDVRGDVEREVVTSSSLVMTSRAVGETGALIGQRVMDSRGTHMHARSVINELQERQEAQNTDLMFLKDELTRLRASLHAQRHQHQLLVQMASLGAATSDAAWALADMKQGQAQASADFSAFKLVQAHTAAEVAQLKLLQTQSAEGFSSFKLLQAQAAEGFSAFKLLQAKASADLGSLKVVQAQTSEELSVLKLLLVRASEDWGSVKTVQGELMEHLRAVRAAQEETAADVRDVVRAEAGLSATVHSLNTRQGAQGAELSVLGSRVGAQGAELSSLGSSVGAQGAELRALRQALEQQNDSVLVMGAVMMSNALELQALHQQGAAVGFLQQELLYRQEVATLRSELGEERQRVRGLHTLLQGKQRPRDNPASKEPSQTEDTSGKDWNLSKEHFASTDRRNEWKSSNSNEWIKSQLPPDTSPQSSDHSPETNMAAIAWPNSTELHLDPKPRPSLDINQSASRTRLQHMVHDLGVFKSTIQGRLEALGEEVRFLRAWVGRQGEEVRVLGAWVGRQGEGLAATDAAVAALVTRRDFDADLAAVQQTLVNLTRRVIEMSADGKYPAEDGGETGGHGEVIGSSWVEGRALDAAPGRAVDRDLSSDSVDHSTQRTTEELTAALVRQATSKVRAELREHEAQSGGILRDLEGRVGALGGRVWRGEEQDRRLAEQLWSMQEQVQRLDQSVQRLDQRVLNASLHQCSAANSELQAQAALHHQLDLGLDELRQGLGELKEGLGGLGGLREGFGEVQGGLGEAQQQLGQHELLLAHQATLASKLEATVATLYADLLQRGGGGVTSSHTQLMTSQLAALTSEVDTARRELLNFILTLPTDCSTIGPASAPSPLVSAVEGGVYLIRPAAANYSLRVYCLSPLRKVNNLGGGNYLGGGTYPVGGTYLAGEADLGVGAFPEGGAYPGGLKELSGEVEVRTLFPVNQVTEELLGGVKESGGVELRLGGEESWERRGCEDEGSGWTVIQRRIDGREEFGRTWDEYKFGFGDPAGEHWLGNEHVHRLTTTAAGGKETAAPRGGWEVWRLRVELWDAGGRHWVACYATFRVDAEGELYRLNLGRYSGNASDAFRYSNLMPFSALDRDQDASTTHCAQFYAAGWWYKHCHHANLNGRHPTGLVWFHAPRDEWLQLTRTTMMISRGPAPDYEGPGGTQTLRGQGGT